MTRRVKDSLEYKQLYLNAIRQYLSSPTIDNAKRVRYYADEYNRVRYWFQRKLVCTFDIN